ncbi:hypothetical protein [Lactobacillus crispatus]|uniref:hypothetical protein n=1 Tax=Lactobacillus crispatus TaxID=47770 RepID=UPI0013F4A8D8|nr:hypothetical protein [Lactobacillus crispatus]
MQDLLFSLWKTILAPILVAAVSYFLQKLIGEWLDSRHRHRRKTHKRYSNKHRKRR